MLPIFEKNLYNIVFVDYENKTANIVETAYGDMVALPDVEPVEGKHFIGWDAECFKYAEDGDVDAEIFNSREETPYYKTTDGSADRGQTGGRFCCLLRTGKQDGRTVPSSVTNRLRIEWE